MSPFKSAAAAADKKLCQRFLHPTFNGIGFLCKRKERKRERKKERKKKERKKKRKKERKEREGEKEGQEEREKEEKARILPGIRFDRK